MFISGGFVFVLVLTYALATELLARNSPTVVYGEACSLVSSSPEVRKHLLPPFKFHTSFSTTLDSNGGDGAGALLPSRGRRSRTVTAAITTDAQTGDELMLVRFFVGARDKDHDLTMWDRARENIVDAAKWGKETVLDTWDDVQEKWDEMTMGEHDALREHNSTHDRLSETSAAAAARAQHDHDDQGRGFVAGALSSLLGSFVGLTRGAGEAVRAGGARATAEPGTWSSGEVHGELHKVRHFLALSSPFFQCDMTLTPC